MNVIFRPFALTERLGKAVRKRLGAYLVGLAMLAAAPAALAVEPLLQVIPARPAVPAPVRKIHAAATPLSQREQELGILNIQAAEPFLRQRYLKITGRTPERAAKYMSWLFDWQYQDRGQFPHGVKGIVLHWTDGNEVFGALDALKGRNNSVHFIITEEMTMPDGTLDSLVLKLMDLNDLCRGAGFPYIKTFTEGGRIYEKYDGQYIDIEVTARSFKQIHSRPKQYQRLLQLVDYLLDQFGLWPQLEATDPGTPDGLHQLTGFLTGHGVIALEYVAAMLEAKRPDLAEYARTDFMPTDVRHVAMDLQAWRQQRDRTEEEAQCAWEAFVKSRTGEAPDMTAPASAPPPPANAESTQGEP